SADILLNTSLVDNMPNSLLEAMASEVVIVSTNVGGIPYMVENRKSSLLVEPGEYRQIADALLYVIENDQERRCMITSAKKRVDNYSWDNIKKSWLNIYTDLVENNI
ncbi:MAG: glycosyltransferase, partial [Gammaproteobacteria bacterium]|nr:glycosyltransferase [Gammaproteobacteria bacterium]